MNHMDTVDDTDTDLVDILPIYHPIWGICENNSCHKQTRYRYVFFSFFESDG